MSIPCPTCRRQLTPDLHDCPRCGTDVNLLQQLQQRYDQALHSGAVALAAQQHQAAEDAYAAAAAIHGHTADVAKGYALLALQRRDFPRALYWHKRQRAARST